MSENPDSQAERGSWWSEWRNRLISGVFGIIVTVVAALILGRLQGHQPHIVFTSTESLPFSGPNGEVSIYQVTLSNDGSKEVYDVACAIRIPSAKIDQYKVTADPLLNVSGTVAGDSVNIAIPNLNPAESVQVSVLASGSHYLPARPEISARGKGVVGSDKTTKSEKSIYQTLPLIALAAASFTMAVSTLLLRLLRPKSGISRDFGDSQRHVLAYICRVHGLPDLAEKYYSQINETTYWAESDRLGQIAIDAGGERMSAIEQALLGLLEYREVASASRAVIYSNIALINLSKKDDALFKKYMHLAKDSSSKEIQRRLKVDPRLTPTKTA